MPFDVNCGKWLVLAIALVCLVMVLPAEAEKPAFATQQSSGVITSGELTPTPDMWFYEQYRLLQQDPKQVVQQNAKIRFAQRQRRLAARQWFGLSKSRPVLNVEPFHSSQYWR